MLSDYRVPSDFGYVTISLKTTLTEFVLTFLKLMHHWR